MQRYESIQAPFDDALGAPRTLPPFHRRQSAYALTYNPPPTHMHTGSRNPSTPPVARGAMPPSDTMPKVPMLMVSREAEREKAAVSRNAEREKAAV
jgi:hypothetical protein